MKYDDVAYGVARSKIEDCLDIMCHNTNVLEANNELIKAILLLSSMAKHSNPYYKLFRKHGIPMTKVFNPYFDRTENSYLVAIQLYKAWGSYAKGNAAEPYVCDSDNGPKPLKKILNSVAYDADDLDLIVTLNKALDVVHFRSDLAAAFIEGGAKTCALVSNLPPNFVV